MGLVCQLIAQPIITVIHVLVTLIEFVLVQICRLIQELVSVLVQMLKYVCNTVVHTVCGAVCSVVCGICDFFCGIFGCDCGCENVCNNVCNAVTQVVCGWTWVLETVLQLVTTLICNYILKAIIVLLNVIEAIVTMVLTWICSIIDVIIRWFLCWTHLADLVDSTDSRRFRVAPKIVPNREGHSDWFVYVNNPNSDGVVDQNMRGYILSDRARPLVPRVDQEAGTIAYYEVETREDFITGVLRRDGNDLVPGTPLLYYPYKVIEIASHLFGDVFASAPGDDGRGTDYHRNLFTYNPAVQDLLAQGKQLAMNNYNAWPVKYKTKGNTDYFGDGTIPDMGMRVDTDATCSNPTNTFLHLVEGAIQFTPGNSDIAESMSCGPGQTLTFDQTNFLMLNKDGDASAVTTYLVSKYNADDSSVGCNDLLGYTIVTFEGGGHTLFVNARVLA